MSSCRGVVGRPFRVLPRITPENEHFWTGGAEGELRFLRCQDCRTWVHPPQPVCPSCLGRELDVEAASGEATLHTFTVSHKEWYPGLTPPYVIAIVDLPEQAGLRLTTNIVDCEPDDVRIDMPLQVTFEQYDDVWLPMFRPRSDADAASTGVAQ